MPEGLKLRDDITRRDLVFFAGLIAFLIFWTLITCYIGVFCLFSI